MGNSWKSHVLSAALLAAAAMPAQAVGPSTTATDQTMSAPSGAMDEAPVGAMASAHDEQPCSCPPASPGSGSGASQKDAQSSDAPDPFVQQIWTMP